MKLILLKDDLFAQVDDADYSWLMQFNWRPLYWGNMERRKEHTYAIAWTGTQSILMHVLLSGFRGVDHVDGNGLNNQRTNLRTATSSENGANINVRHNSTTGFKGVSKRKTKFRSEITHNGKRYRLGDYASARMAARVYDEAALKLFGEYAKTNAMMGLLVE